MCRGSVARGLCQGERRFFSIEVLESREICVKQGGVSDPRRRVKVVLVQCSVFSSTLGSVYDHSPDAFRGSMTRGEESQGRGGA
jgi:hypothetical protein